MKKLKLTLISLLCVSSAQGALISTFTHNGHTYQIWGNSGGTDDRRTWADANTFAGNQTLHGQTGYLTTISNVAENTAIFTALNNIGGSFTSNAADGGNVGYAWIGANDRSTEGSWVWSEDNTQFYSGNGNSGGTAVGGLYNNWGSFEIAPGFNQSEPDNFTDAGTAPNGQDAGAIALSNWPVGTAGQWNDIAETNNMAFVVEFNAVPEPSSALLFGMAGLTALLRRKRA